MRSYARTLCEAKYELLGVHYSLSTNSWAYTKHELLGVHFLLIITIIIINV
jgi:hypothetical protein